MRKLSPITKKQLDQLKYEGSPEGSLDAMKRVFNLVEDLNAKGLKPKVTIEVTIDFDDAAPPKKKAKAAGKS